MAIPLAIMLAGGSSIMSGIAGIASGFQQKKAAKAKAMEAEIEAKMAKIRGTQIGERSREDLANALGNIESIRSTRGMSSDSQTGQAIERRTIQDAYRDEAVAVLGELNRASSAQMQARGYRSQARWAVPLSVLGASADFMKAGSQLTMGMK